MFPVCLEMITVSTGILLIARNTSSASMVDRDFTAAEKVMLSTTTSEAAMALRTSPAGQ
jgi:hypothetical protein